MTYTLEVRQVNEFHVSSTRAKILDYFKTMHKKEGLEQFESRLEMHSLFIANQLGLVFSTFVHEPSNTIILKFIESELV